MGNDRGISGLTERAELGENLGRVAGESVSSMLVLVPETSVCDLCGNGGKLNSLGSKVRML